MQIGFYVQEAKLLANGMQEHFLLKKDFALPLRYYASRRKRFPMYISFPMPPLYLRVWLDQVWYGKLLYLYISLENFYISFLYFQRLTFIIYSAYFYMHNLDALKRHTTNTSLVMKMGCFFSLRFWVLS